MRRHALTPHHLRLLEKIDSPLLRTIRAMENGTESTDEAIASSRGQNFEIETREILFVLATPFQKLKHMERMTREEIRAAAIATIAPAQNQPELESVQRLIGFHVAVSLAKIPKRQQKQP